MSKLSVRIFFSFYNVVYRLHVDDGIPEQDVAASFRPRFAAAEDWGPVLVVRVQDVGGSRRTWSWKYFEFQMLENAVTMSGSAKIRDIL